MRRGYGLSGGPPVGPVFTLDRDRLHEASCKTQANMGVSGRKGALGPDLNAFILSVIGGEEIRARRFIGTP